MTAIHLRDRSPLGGLQVFVCKTGGKRKRGSRPLRPLERAVAQAARAQEAFSTTYRRRHERANLRRRNGWLRDLDRNVDRAWRKARKRIKLAKILKL